jgi:hypothetical protein
VTTATSEQAARNAIEAVLSSGLFLAPLLIHALARILA